MNFLEPIGNTHIKAHLEETLKNGRIPHSQLFVGENGAGVLPMALNYAKQILCSVHALGSPEHAHCAKKIDSLSHPDLHFVYPVNTGTEIKKNAISDHYAQDWREFVTENPYRSLFEWLQAIGIEKKQGNISKYEAESMAKKLSLKSYEGGYKVMIIWMADNMNTECANKILKLVEEPTENTILLFLTEKEEQIIATIRSRCQKINFLGLSEEEISSFLVKNNNLTEILAKKIAIRSQGNLNTAFHLIENESENIQFDQWFSVWVRSAFRAKGNKSAINQLLDWSDSLASQGRETQKKFLFYCIDVFRQALLQNYSAKSLVFFESSDKSFAIEKFAPFVHQNNIFEIFKNLEEAHYNIERNGNGKIIFTDLSIQLTRLIHKKA